MKVIRQVFNKTYLIKAAVVGKKTKNILKKTIE